MSVPLLNDLVLVYGNAFGPPGYHRVVDVATQQSVDLNGGRSATENEHDACFLWEKHASPTLDQQQVLADVIVISEGEHVPDDMRRLTRDVRAFDVPTHVYGRVMSMEECDNPITDVRVLSSDDALAEAESFKRISGAVGKSPQNSLYFLWCRRKRARESALEEQSKLFQGTSSSSSSSSASSSSPSSSSSSSSTSSQHFDREEKNSGKSLEVMTVVEGLEWHVTQSDIESMHSAVTMCAREGGLNTQLVQLAVRCIQSHVLPREQRSNLFSYVLCPIIEHLGRLLQSDVASLPAAVLPTILRVLGGDSNCSYFYTHFGHDLDYVACDFRLRASNNAAKQQMTRSNYYASKPKVVQNTACSSVYVVDAVNRFDAVGGFEGLIRRLVPDAGSAFLFSFANTALAAVLLCQICEVLDSALMNNYIIRFHEALMLSIQHAKISTKQESDEALRLLRESIVPSILRMIEIMKPKLLPSSSSFSISFFLIEEVGESNKSSSSSMIENASFFGERGPVTCTSVCTPCNNDCTETSPFLIFPFLPLFLLLLLLLPLLLLLLLLLLFPPPSLLNIFKPLFRFAFAFFSLVSCNLFCRIGECKLIMVVRLLLLGVLEAVVLLLCERRSLSFRLATSFQNLLGNIC